MKSLLLCILFIIGSCSKLEKRIDFSISIEEWKEDLRYLKNKITSKHANPYHSISKEELNKYYSNAYNKLDSVTGIEASLVLAEFAATIGDGHTYVNPYSQFDRFPLRLGWYRNKLRINTISRDLKKYQGSEVLKFGEFNTENAIKKVMRLIPKEESENLIKNYSSYYLSISEVLFALKLNHNQDSLYLTVKNQNGTLESFMITKTSEAKENLIPLFKEKIPLRYSKNSHPLWHKKINKSGIGYFNFSRYPSRRFTKSYGRDLNNWIKKENIKTLIIDFRENGGGDFQKGRIILSKIKNTVLSRKIKVYVAIGMFTFSAGMSNASDFQRGLNGKYIGEISGARPNGYQENNDFILPNSKIKCSYSSKYYKFSDEDTPGIIPHIKIEYQWDDFFSGKDSLIEWVITNSDSYKE